MVRLYVPTAVNTHVYVVSTDRSLSARVTMSPLGIEAVMLRSEAHV